MQVFNVTLCKKYLNKYSQKYVTSFYPNHNNELIYLLKKNNYSNMEISLNNTYNYLYNKVKLAINIIPKKVLKNSAKIFIKELVNKNNNLLVECAKDKIFVGHPINGGISHKLLLITKLEEILENKNNPLYNKLKILYDHRHNFCEFEEEYENLLPYDRMILVDKIKNYILPYYHDFYTYPIPLNIQSELESKKLKLLCHFRKFDNDSIFYTLNIKVPEIRSVKFNRGGRFKHVVEINRRKNVANEQYEKPPKHPMRKAQFYGGKKKYHRLLARIGWAFGSKNKSLLSRPLDIHIFESTKPKKIQWHQRVIVNKKINGSSSLNLLRCRRQRSKGGRYPPVQSTSVQSTSDNSVLDPNDEKILNKYLGTNEINTGYSLIGGNPTNKMVIYRKEELDKIFIHEMVHIMRLEKNLFDNKILQFFKKYLKYDQFCKGSYQSCNYSERTNDQVIMRITEAYTDFCADIINMFLYAIEIGTNEKFSLSKTIDLFIDFLFIEINFSLFQTAKFLTYFGFESYYDIFDVSIKQGINEFLGERYFNNTSYSQESKKKSFSNFCIIRQTTCAFSYFVLRLILLLNAEEIFKVLNQTFAFPNGNLHEHTTNLTDYLNLDTRQKGKKIQKILIKGLIDKRTDLFSTNQIINLYMELIRLLKIEKMGISGETVDILKCVNQNECSIDDGLMQTMRRSIIEFD